MELVFDMHVLSDAKSRMLTMDEYIYLFYGAQEIELDLSVNVPKLVRLGYLDKDLCFTDACLELVPEHSTMQVEMFEEFWETYPLNDAFFNHPKTRTLRMNKAYTKKEYVKQSKIYGEDFIMDALRREIEDRMENSSGKKNSFTFMKSSLNYLKEQAFMQYA
jgi:hypothetical protein